MTIQFINDWASIRYPHYGWGIALLSVSFMHFDLEGLDVTNFNGLSIVILGVGFRVGK